MNQLACPHCGAMNVSASAFCEACGKALPVTGGPRLVEGGGTAKTAAGRELQAVELQKKAKSAAGALLAVGILMAIGGFLIPFLLEHEADKLRGRGMMIDRAKLEQIIFVARIQQFVVAGVFVALFFWARVNPFPPAIIGLVLIVSLWVVAAIMDPTSIAQGLIVKIIIIAVLVKAIQAGAQFRELQRQGAAA